MYRSCWLIENADGAPVPIARIAIIRPGHAADEGARTDGKRAHTNMIAHLRSGNKGPLDVTVRHGNTAGYLRGCTQLFAADPRGPLLTLVFQEVKLTMLCRNELSNRVPEERIDPPADA